MTKKEKSRYIPARFKIIKRNDEIRWILIFEFSDFITDKRPAEFQKLISEELDEMLEKIKKIISDGRPSKIKRSFLWDIGDLIIRKRNEIAERYGIYITNMVEAVAIKLGIAPRTVNFFVQFRKNVPRKKIDENIPWKIYQTALLLKDKSKVLECINLYKNRKLKNTNDVLKYVQKCNKNFPKKSLSNTK